MPRLLPHNWTGGVLLLVIVFVISGFLDNIAAAIIGGTVARHVFDGKVHIGYLAAIVAASNASGAGSVVGDTTTTMMWVAGVSPLVVVEAYVPSFVALMIFAVPASLQQQRRSPIVKKAHAHIDYDWTRVVIVGCHQHRLQSVFSRGARPRAGPRSFALGGAFRGRAIAAAGLEHFAGDVERHDLSDRAGDGGLYDAGREAAGCIVADGARPGLRLGRVRQHPADGAGPEAGRL
jgi:hypothetical protein